MKIGLVCQYFPPEVAPIGVMLSELADDLAISGHDVTIFTGYPNHPKGKIFHGYRQRFLGDVVRLSDNVVLCRSWLFISSSKLILLRAFNYISFTISSIFYCTARRQDIYLIVSPPLTNILIGFFLRIIGRRYILNIQDVYPDAAVATGVVKNKLLIRLLSRLENLAYHFSYRVTVISEGFRRNLSAKGVPPHKIMVIPNWIDLDEVQPRSRSNPFSEEHKIDSLFTVMYSGTIGRVSGAEIVLEMATLLADDSNLVVMMIGEGVVKAQIEEQAQIRGLANIRFVPFQPRDRLADVLSSASVGLVTLLPGYGANSVPSKVLGYLAAARPVIASVDPGSDTWRFIEEQAQCGLCVPPGDSLALAKAALNLRSNPQLALRLGMNGRSYLEQNLDRSQITAMYKAVLCN